MAAYDQMPFPPAIGLPGTYMGHSMSGPPPIDGFVEAEPGITTTQLDAGYTEGGRFVYGGASGVPVAVFQAVSDSNYLYVSFVSRYDPSFDDDDYALIVLRPNPALGPTTADRRIDVNPVQTGLGGAAAAPVDPNDSGPLPLIRTNKGASVTYYGRSAGGSAHPWTTLASTPTNVTTKVRSVYTGTDFFWSVEIQIPRTAALGGPAWVDLQPNFGLYFNIGQAFIDGDGVESVTQYPWPMNPLDPTANFLADPFGGVQKRDWDPPTLGTGMIIAPGAPNPALGVRFRNAYAGIGILDGGGNVGSYLDMTLNHTNKFVAQLQNTHPNTAPKVRARFRIAEFGISGGLWDADWKDLPTPANTNPAPHAGVDIPQTVSPTGHTDIELDWQISAADRTKFGPLNRDQCLWVQLDSVATGATAQFVETSTRRNLTVTNLSNASLRATVHPELLHDKHLIAGKTHELLVRVSSTPVKVTKQTTGQKVMVEAGIPIDRTLSAATPIADRPLPLLTRLQPIAPQPTVAAGREAAISREAATRLPISKVIPIASENPVLSGKIAMVPIGKVPITNIATWYSVVNAYQKTAKTLTFNGKKRRIYVYAGSYGVVARHVMQAGETIAKLQLNHQIAATPGVKAVGKNQYKVTVSAKQPLNLTNNLATKKVTLLTNLRGAITRFIPGR